MRPLYKVVLSHKSDFPEPMMSETGEQVKVGREDDDMPGWYWCRNREGIEAWVPKTHIDIQDNIGVFKQPYNSYEHTVEQGELVQYLDECQGWVECLDKE